MPVRVIILFAWILCFIFAWARMFSKQKSSDLEFVKTKIKEWDFFIDYPGFAIMVLVIISFLTAPIIAIGAFVKDIIRLFSKPGKH